MRIVYFGSGEFGLPTLKALCAEHEVGLVVTQPDRPAGRKRVLTPTPIAVEAAALGLEVIKPEKVNAPEVIERIAAVGADANVVVAFGQKIGPEVISSPSLGPDATVNLHASILPKYRGAAPINWAIIRGEKVSGNTVFSLVDRMDAGAILGIQETKIEPLETAGELHDRLSLMGPELVFEVLRGLADGSITPREQDESLMSIAPKLGRDDGQIDFRFPASHLQNRVQGLTPWPGIRVWWAPDPTVASEDRSPLILRRIRALPEDNSPEEPGRMIRDGVVKTGDGAIELVEVQPLGKRVMSWQDYRRGNQVPIGAVFYQSQDE
jgi:methionyl-tRNA formyltransferase